MKYDPQKHPFDDTQGKRRKSIRLQGYDYSQAGVYFVTIVTQGRTSLFGEIVDGEMRLNEAGKMVEKIWLSIPERFPSVELGAYMVMPNHFHGDLIILESGAIKGAGMNPAPTRPTLGQIIGAFKSITTHEYIQGVKKLGWPAFDKRIWQRNYYEHIIRNMEETDRIERYIESNPKRWADDDENHADRSQGRP